jgi:hypothetical protein
LRGIRACGLILVPLIERQLDKRLRQLRRIIGVDAVFPHQLSVVGGVDLGGVDDVLVVRVEVG